MIYERLRTAVKGSGLNQKEFALKIGKSPNGFNAIVKGHKEVGRTLALAVQALTSYSAEWIMTGEGSPKLDRLKGLSNWEKLVLEHSNNSERRIAEEVCLWMDSKAGPKKFSFENEDAWDSDTLFRYEELIREVKELLNEFLKQIKENPEDFFPQALFRGMLVTLYYGYEGLDSEKDMYISFLNLDDPLMIKIIAIRSELEKLIGDQLKHQKQGKLKEI